VLCSQTAFYKKLVNDGCVECVEHVLQFCQRQQRRLQEATPSTAAVPPPTSLSDSLSAQLPPAGTSSIGAPSTLTWLRVLCLDMLSTVHTSCPGFIRAHMETKFLHSNALVTPNDDNHITHQRGNRQGKHSRKRTVSNEIREHAYLGQSAAADLGLLLVSCCVFSV
jgi:hypothetical protein